MYIHLMTLIAKARQLQVYVDFGDFDQDNIIEFCFGPNGSSYDEIIVIDYLNMTSKELFALEDRLEKIKQ